MARPKHPDKVDLAAQQAKLSSSVQQVIRSAEEVMKRAENAAQKTRVWKNPRLVKLGSLRACSSCRPALLLMLGKFNNDAVNNSPPSQIAHPRLQLRVGMCWRRKPWAGTKPPRPPAVYLATERGMLAQHASRAMLRYLLK
jgi:hypothetical protein